MQDDLEEVVLFPAERAALNFDGDEAPATETLGDAATARMREWLATQLTQSESVLRKQQAPSKPSSLSPELVAYIQACEAQAGRKATREAYMKALQKLDYFNERS
jgi:hypothetical protein